MTEQVEYVQKRLDLLDPSKLMYTMLAMGRWAGGMNAQYASKLVELAMVPCTCTGATKCEHV